MGHVKDEISLKGNLFSLDRTLLSKTKIQTDPRTHRQLSFWDAPF